MACAYEIQGMYCESTGDFDAALENYKTARTHNPKDSNLAQRIEQLYEKLRSVPHRPASPASGVDELYSILEVRPDASAEVIASARKALLLKYHPDRNPDRPDWAHEMTRRVLEAYEILSDPEKRRLYERHQR
jgi:tetratricopeptide (TPR) repeat protein